ncbi:MAG: cytochrome c oxidase accessory protein CcoG [Roseococcus sp.]|nr:cytochrome c oxidase accessory protein CcoG [Roseococcus sp.]
MSVPTSEPSLYAAHQKVYPRAVSGPVRRAKWAVLAALLSLYYLVPWIRWDRGEGVPDQAVLVDMAHARLFFFWFEIWPQEVYFLTGALVLGAIGLFAVTSLFGRLWCGFTCPQTVWTDLFMWVERRIEGDRNARMKLDQGPRNARWWRLKLVKHAAWLAIAMATGGAWIMYFNDAPTVAVEILTGRASLAVYGFFGLFTATTYVLAGAAREQVCTYMCPWPRFQAAMLDEDSRVVTYRAWRGEPRGKPDGGHGDCVDCKACLHVCPTGIDIRDGQQLECIGCGLCIDACDEVMAKLGRTKGLIAFETLKNLAASEAATRGLPPGPERLAAGMAARRPQRLIRPRTLLYAGVLTAVLLVMLGAWLMRETLTLSVQRDRAPLYVTLSDGGIRNGYTLKLAHKGRGETLQLAVVLEGPQGLRLTVQDAPRDAAGRPVITTREDGITQWRALVTAPPGLRLPESTPVTFRLLDAQGRSVLAQGSSFLGPRP